MAFGHRVSVARKARKLSQQQLADLISVGSPVTINQPVIGSIESRDSTNSKHAPKIAKALDVSLEWLLTGFGASGLIDPDDETIEIAGTTTNVDVYDDNEPAMLNEIEFPMYDTVEVSAGNGSVIQEVVKTKEKLRLSRSLLDRLGVAKDKVVGAKLKGDSLDGLIQDGSTIAIDLSKADHQIRNNKIYVIQVGGEYKAKILQRHFDNTGVYIKSTNPEYADVSMSNIDFEREVTVIGWVFWWSNFVKW